MEIYDNSITQSLGEKFEGKMSFGRTKMEKKVENENILMSADGLEQQ